MLNATGNVGKVLLKIAVDPQAKRDFYLNTEAFLQEHGYNFDKQKELQQKDQEEYTALLKQGTNGGETTTTSGLSVNTHWWGIDLTFSEATTQSIIAGTMDVAELSAIIAGGLAAVPGIDAIAVVVAAAIAGTAVVMKSAIEIVDSQHKGIHFNIYWPTIPLLATPVWPLPATVVADLVPLPN